MKKRGARPPIFLLLVNLVSDEAQQSELQNVMYVIATEEVWRFDVEHGRKFLVQGQRYKTISLLRPTKID